MWKNLKLGVGAVALMCLPACGIFAVHGNGHKVTETRDLTGFARVENHSPLDVVVREAATATINVTLDDDLQKYITTSLSGDSLIINNSDDLSFQGEGRVVVTLPRFLGAKNSASGSVLVENVTQSNPLSFVLEGSGDLKYCGPASSLSAKASGSGSITLCTPKEQVLESVNLSSDDSGGLTYDGFAKSLEAINDGSGDMHLSGQAPRFVARLNSSGEVEAQGFTSTDGELRVNGSGDVRATVTGTVSVYINSSGNVELWGGASARDVFINGSGSLRRH